MKLVKTDILNPVEVLKNYFNLPEDKISWIKYAPEIEPQYFIRRRHRHDGTLMFTVNLLREVLNPLTSIDSYYEKTMPAEWSLVEGIKYTVGDIKVSTFVEPDGCVDLPCGRVPGIIEEAEIPVKIEYVMKNKTVVESF